MTSTKQTLPSLRTLFAEGASALRRYKGLIATLYAVQFTVMVVVSMTIASVLTSVFADNPVFDRAVDGDLAALVFVFTDEPYVFVSIVRLAIAAIVGYWLISWFLIGGLNAVLIERPTTKAEVIRQFGNGGIRTLFAYARLTLLSLIPYAIISFALMYGMASAGDDLYYGLSDGEVIRALLPKILPGLVLLLFHVTALDYARIELSRTVGTASRHALWRGYRTAARDWRPLAHMLAYIGFFVAVSLLYVLITSGQPMAGAGGAILLFLVRQLSLMIRFAGKIACAGGQVMYASERAHDKGSKKRLPVIA